MSASHPNHITISIDEFPKDGRFWIVDWLGAIEKNPQVETEPTVEVTISPFRENVSIHLPPNKIVSKEIIDYDQERTIIIGVW